MMIALAALVTALALASLAVSVYALFNAHRLFHASKIITETVRAECAGIVATAQSQCSAIALELQTVKSHAVPTEPVPGTPKAGMNLTRRSHALRLHRTGSSPEHIAASLEVPRQEVELLLKVHQIVLNNL
jgi:hypothetical protein